MAADAPDVRTLEVRGWLLRTSEDLRAGRHDLTAVPPLLNDVAFHAQQCAEKAMKALLVHREQAFRKTHNLTELGGAVARIEPSLADPYFGPNFQFTAVPAPGAIALLGAASLVGSRRRR